MTVPLIETQGMVKDYRLGSHTVHALRGVSVTIQPGGVRRGHGPLRLREVHLHESPGVP